MMIDHPKKVYSAAMRGRYTSDGIKQNLEIRSEEFTNALTTVQKDTLIVEIYEDNIEEQDNIWQKRQESES